MFDPLSLMSTTSPVQLLCPFPGGMLAQQLSKFPNAKGTHPTHPTHLTHPTHTTHLTHTEFVWSQEEPENMGPWSFIAPRFRRLLGVDVSHHGTC